MKAEFRDDRVTAELKGGFYGDKTRIEVYRPMSDREVVTITLCSPVKSGEYTVHYNSYSFMEALDAIVHFLGGDIYWSDPHEDEGTEMEWGK